MQDYVLVNFESIEGAMKAVQILNNTFLPVCGATLSVQFAPALGLGPPGAEAPATPAQPIGEFRPPGSASGELGWQCVPFSIPADGVSLHQLPVVVPAEHRNWGPAACLSAVAALRVVC